MKQELEGLRSYVLGLSDRYQLKTDVPGGERRYREWKQRQVLVVGGQEKWQDRLRDYFPNWQFVGEDIRRMPPDFLREKKFIVCNVERLNRAGYLRLLAMRDPEQRILYVHGDGPQRCLEELEKQLE